MLKVDRAQGVLDWNKLIAYRRGMEVARWHTRKPVFPETVGHHTANVALLCDILTDGECSKDLLMAALVHDVGEFYTGDLPAPVKVDDPELSTRIHDLDAKYLSRNGITVPFLVENEKNVLRAADIIDLVWTAALELRVGNSDYQEVLERGIQYLKALQLPNRQQAIVDNIMESIVSDLRTA